MHAEGFTTDKFAPLRETFEGNFASGADIGASVSVRVGDETVVDLWGGHADAGQTKLWVKDTIVNVYSTTKTMTALTALLLADRGLIDFGAPVAKYWPEFAQGGKSRVTVAQIMSHSSGLSGWREPVSKQDLYDWERAVELLAAQEPFWEPGTASGYHAVTMGFLVGEVVRRVTGKSLGTVFREEIAEPLGADFWIGLPPSEDDRVAELIEPPKGTGLDANLDALNEIQKNWIVNPLFSVDDSKTRGWRAAELGASNGQGNARSIALVHTILANGGVANGKRFMSEAGCRKALELQMEGTDLILAQPARIGLGFGLASGMMPGINDSTMFWGGYGGSIAIIDMQNRMSFGYAMNKMAGTTMGDMRALGLFTTALQAMSAT
ncbi:MAG: beta-lactamase family protein [Proteobacteria bacterium]|nr:beta-lactamase family protein [Pseudomonadota bacterium]